MQLATQHTAELVLIAVAAPFLLFPTLARPMTLLMLCLLSLLWAAQALRRQAWPVTPFNGVLLLFAVMVFVSILTTPAPDLTLPKATGIVLGLAVFRAVAGLRGQRSATLCLVGLILAGLAVWAVGLVDLDWPSKIPFLQTWWDRLPQHIVRIPEAPQGGVSPNQLAGTIVLVLPAALVALLGGSQFPNPRLLRPLGLGAAILWGGTLFLTQSRGGWVGGAVGALSLVALWAASARRPWQRMLGIALAALAVLGSAIILRTVGVDRVTGLLDGASEGSVETAVGAFSFQGRVEIWSRALYMMYDFPFTGQGLGAFRESLPALYPLFLVRLERYIPHAHNVFLHVGVDLGLPGLVAYLSLLVVGVWIGWNRVQRGGWERWLGLGVLAGLIGYHVFGLTDTVALGSKPSFLFWWLMGLLAIDPDP
jgi:putative inorganic carbon (HCO3(-)) transporter